MVCLLVDEKKIQKAKSRLGDKNFKIILDALGVQDYDEQRMRCCCPIHSEKTPSFIYSRDRYAFHCFGCGVNVDVLDALMRGQKMTFAEAAQELFRLAGVQHSFGEIGVKTKRQYKYPKPVECSDKSAVYKYLAKRKISPSTVDYLDIRQDHEGNIVFNYYDLNDNLTMVKYRPSRVIKKGENKNWTQHGADTTPLLFNMNRINPAQPLLITSGELDAAAAIEAGYSNAVSIPLGDGNEHWVSECWDFLEQFDEIIIAPDNDESGRKYVKSITPRLGDWRCKVVQVPEYYEKPDGERVKVKDLNEVLFWFGKEKLLEIIVNAKQSEVPEVIDYADIEDFDISQVDGITTGLNALDKIVRKFCFGTTAIITGVAGSGKSSLISQIVGQTLEQGYNAFVYSGELENPMLKNWIDFVLAGQRNLNAKESATGPYYKVKPEAISAMKEYYRGRLWIYRDDFTQSASKMLSVMESMVRRNNTKVVVIDNMTSIDLECTDTNKYFKQDEFIRRVIDFSKKFKCLCIIVIHPKKMDEMRRMSMFDLQGVVSSVNLCHYLISLYRAQEKDHLDKNPKTGKPQTPMRGDVVCDILKNRMTGALGSAELFYDMPSRRFFEDEQSLDFQYKWDTKSYGVTPLPFPPPQLDDNYDSEILGEVKEDDDG